MCLAMVYRHVPLIVFLKSCLLTICFGALPQFENLQNPQNLSFTMVAISYYIGTVGR